MKVPHCIFAKVPDDPRGDYVCQHGRRLKLATARRVLGLDGPHEFAGPFTAVDRCGFHDAPPPEVGPVIEVHHA